MECCLSRCKMKKETYSYTDEIQKEVLQLVSKYESLVWYARSGAPYTDEPSDVWCRKKLKLSLIHI